VLTCAVWRKDSLKTHNLLGKGKIAFLANNLNWSIKSAVYLRVLRFKAKWVALLLVWFIGGDLCKLFRSATSFFILVVNL
jgi:hypothetical protein